MKVSIAITKLALWIITSLYVLLSQAAKMEYIKVKTDRAEVIQSDSNLARIKITTFKYNRTTTALNVTLNLKVQLKNGNTKVMVQAYKFASNEYRLFPITFDAEVCSSFSSNYFGMRNLGLCGNFSTYCSIKPGKYIICNWTPDDSRFPPHLILGKFKINLKFIFSSMEMFEMNWYISVEDEWYKHI